MWMSTEFMSNRAKASIVSKGSEIVIRFKLKSYTLNRGNNPGLFAAAKNSRNDIPSESVIFRNTSFRRSPPIKYNAFIPMLLRKLVRGRFPAALLLKQVFWGNSNMSASVFFNALDEKKILLQKCTTMLNGRVFIIRHNLQFE